MDASDVIVIGGGPAGIAAAITCVQAGLKVVLITGQKQNEPNVIADHQPEPLQSLHPGAFGLLRRLGVGGVIDYASYGTYTGIQTGNTYSPLSTIDGETWEGHHIAPSLFVDYTVLKAKEFGVYVRFECRVNDIVCNEETVSGVILSDGLQLNCSYLIDASGRKRFAGRHLKFKEELFSRPLVSYTGTGVVESNIVDDPNHAHFQPNGNGWLWKAYSNNGHYTWTKLGDNHSDDAFFKEIAASHQPAAIKAANMQWRVFRPLACPGLLLAGDAAGVLDPAAGQGILSALMSGIMVGQTVVSSLNDPLLSNWHLSRYDDWFMEHFNHKKDALSKRYAEMGIDVSLQG